VAAFTFAVEGFEFVFLFVLVVIFAGDVLTELVDFMASFFGVAVLVEAVCACAIPPRKNKSREAKTIFFI